MAAGDYDGDGHADLLVTGLRGVGLRRNRGDGTFAKATAQAGLDNQGRWSVAAAWFDKDNDEANDVAMARSDALSPTGGHGATAKEPPSWLRNLGGAKFALGQGWGHLPPEMYRGIVAADLGNDGCLDIVLTALNAQPRVLRNPCTPPGSNWLKVEPHGGLVGARVRVGSQWREAGSATGYASSYLGPLHFGLGRARVVAEVEVIWPGGAKKLLRKVAANQTLKVEP